MAINPKTVQFWNKMIWMRVAIVVISVPTLIAAAISIREVKGSEREEQYNQTTADSENRELDSWTCTTVGWIIMLCLQSIIVQSVFTVVFSWQRLDMVDLNISTCLVVDTLYSQVIAVAYLIGAIVIIICAHQWDTNETEIQFFLKGTLTYPSFLLLSVLQVTKLGGSACIRPTLSSYAVTFGFLLAVMHSILGIWMLTFLIWKWTRSGSVPVLV